MVKNYFYNLLLTITNLLFPILSFPYVSRVLGPEGIGQVQFVFSFAQYFSIIASFGIPIYGLREISKYQNDASSRHKVFSELIIINSIACCVMGVAYLIVINSFPYFEHQHDLYTAALLMVVLGFTNIEWLYSGMEEFKAIALRSVIFKVLGLVLLYTFVQKRSDYGLYLYLLMFSYLGNNILSLALLKHKIKFALSGLQLKRHFAPLFFILGTTLAASMYTDMDTVLLGFLSDKKAVGFYTAAVKLTKIAIPFVTSMNVILMPKVGRHFADGPLLGVNQIIEKAFRFILFFAIPIVFGLALLAPEFIELFSGREFLPAVNSMRLLSALPFIIGIAHLFLFLILVPSNHNKQMFICVAGGVITSLVLNFLLVPRYQEVGSASANIIAEIVVTSFYYYYIKKFFSVNFPWRLLFEAILCSLLFIPVIAVTRVLGLPTLFNVLIAVSGCAVTYLLTQLFFKNLMLLDGLSFIKLKLKLNK
jgi:O-antigen/teichoic acid export membrane protein